MQNLEILISTLKQRIQSAKRAEGRRTYFPADIKYDAVACAHKCKSHNEAAKKLGIAQGTLSRWVREHPAAFVSPRRLKVVATADAVSDGSRQILPQRSVDVTLPNGIVLKAVLFDNESLAVLLGGAM